MTNGGKTMFGGRKLTKSRTDRKICGVCGGIGAFLDMDSTAVRVLWVILSVLSFGTGVLAYLICALVMPD